MGGFAELHIGETYACVQHRVRPRKATRKAAKRLEFTALAQTLRKALEFGFSSVRHTYKVRISYTAWTRGAKTTNREVGPRRNRGKESLGTSQSDLVLHPN